MKWNQYHNKKITINNEVNDKLFKKYRIFKILIWYIYLIYSFANGNNWKRRKKNANNITYYDLGKLTINNIFN